MVELSTRKGEIRGDGGNHYEELGIREIRVRVKLPFPIWQVRVPIRRVFRPIRGLLNPIWQAVILIAHSCSEPAYCCHLHPPSLPFSSTTLPSSQEHTVKSSLCISPCHHHELTLSAAYTKYSIHRVWHTPKIVCHPFILTIPSSPLNVASASSEPPYQSTVRSQFSIAASNIQSPRHMPTVSSSRTDE